MNKCHNCDLPHERYAHKWIVISGVHTCPDCPPPILGTDDCPGCEKSRVRYERWQYNEYHKAKMCPECFGDAPVSSEINPTGKIFFGDSSDIPNPAILQTFACISTSPEWITVYCKETYEPQLLQFLDGAWFSQENDEYSLEDLENYFMGWTHPVLVPMPEPEPDWTTKEGLFYYKGGKATSGVFPDIACTIVDLLNENGVKP